MLASQRNPRPHHASDISRNTGRASISPRARPARLLPMWPAELADPSTEGRRRRIAKLRRALREERRRGPSGHWTYDLARHAALYRTYRRELAAEHANLARSAVLPAPTSRNSR